MSFKLSAIRELNQVALFYSGKDSPTELVFKAYLTQGYDFNLGIQVEDAFKSLNITNNIGALGKSIINEITGAVGSGVTAVLDIPVKTTFMGSNIIPFTVTCSLFVVNSFEEDIQNPLVNLMEFLLPKTNETFNTKTLFKNVNRYLDEKKVKSVQAKREQGNTTYTGGVWELMQKGADWLQKYLGTVGLMDVPGQFGSSAKSLTLYLPGFVVPDVYVDSVSVKVPYLTYANKNDEPFIDRVDVTLNIKSMRVATTNYVQFMK